MSNYFDTSDTSDTSDLTDAQIQWALDQVGSVASVSSVRTSPAAIHCAIRALARIGRDHPDLFEKPVDPDVLAVREAMAKRYDDKGRTYPSKQYRAGQYDNTTCFLAALDLYRAGKAEKPTEPEWIKWSGGECPVPDGADCEMRFRGGTVSRWTHARRLTWLHNGVDGDIVAYRVWS